MRFPFSNRSLVIRSLVVAFAFSVLASIAVAHYIGEQQHPAGTETTYHYDKDGGALMDKNTYDDKGRLVEKKEYQNVKLRKRTTYTYLTGFKDPNTSTTTYGPDGTTPEKTTNVDHDKDGNPTVTTTIDYDKDGKEIGGTKRERDPKTGKERCYKWDPKKQEYEEVPCPESVTQTTQPQPSPSSEGKNKSEEKKPSSENARVETANGLQRVTFDTPQGQVTVNLPDDMRAGDTISGTVVAEPKGQTPEVRAKNMTELNSYVIELEPPKKPDGTGGANVKPAISAAIVPFIINLPPIRSPAGVSSSNSDTVVIRLTNTTGSFPTAGAATVPIEIVSLSLQSVAPLKVPQLPSIGQQGRPIEIIGPFDGNSSNTQLNWTRPRSAVQDFEKNTENVSGGFGLIAESPRKAVFTAPSNVTGPIEITLTEGNTKTTGTYRNVGVNLTAPKTSLLKGESTELHVEVNGLQGITEPIPLHLTKGGVVTMQGGDVQTIRIPPSDVNAYGTYATTRTITGVQAGAWNATATVVVFDVCLQDEKTGDLLQFNSTTGDYRFCNVFPTVVAGDPGRINISWYGTTTPDTGSVGWSGCTITLRHNSTDGRVTAQTDRCAQTGSATVQPASSKTTFTITDRDTRNNTCACK